MSYTPVDIPAFGGLDFTDEEDATGAIDMLNCFVERVGRLASRPGYEAFGAATSGVGASGSYAYNAFASYTNLVANPDFESGTGNWTATNATLSQGGSAGSRYLTITPTQKNVSVLSSFMTVSASTAYVAQGTLLDAGGSLYNVAFTVKWYKSDDTYISESSLLGGTTPQTVSVLVTSPALAAKAKISISGTDAGQRYALTCDSFVLTAGTYTGGFFAGTITSSATNLVCGYSGATDSVKLMKSDGSVALAALTSVTGAAATDTFTKTAHGMPNGTAVTLSSLTGGSGLSTSSTYYVVSAADNTFKLSTTVGGAAEDFTTDVTSVTVTPVSLQGLTAGNRWSFTALGGSAFGGNGKVGLVQATVSAIKQPSVYSRTSGAAAWGTQTKAAPKPLFVTYQTPDNRLVAAGFTGTSDGPNGVATTPATVFFSQGDSTSWAASDNALRWDETDYVVVGDAQDPITGVANWGDVVVVMKQNDWFLFYGNSTDADGGTVFNHRRIEPGCEMVSWAVGVNGLYVTDTDSNIHRFTGGVPKIVFRGSDRYQALPGQGFNAHPFVGLPAEANGKPGYLIFDDRIGQVYFFAFDKTLTAGSNAGQSVYFPYTQGVAVFPSGTTDGGATITASYTSSYSAMGRAGVEKTIRETEIHGTGTVDLSWGRELQDHGSATTVMMSRGRGLARTAVRGESLSWKVSGSSWAINRVVHFLREIRPPGVKT